MEPEITQEGLNIRALYTVISKVGGLVLSLRSCDYPRSCDYLMGEIVIGCPGLPNLIKTFRLGDAVLVQTPNDGLIEVRAVWFSRGQAQFLITRVSPRLGLIAGLAQDTAINPPFHQDEIAEIKRNIQAIYLAMSERPDVSKEQLDLIQRTLDDVAEASQRLGRKDWTMFLVGTLTNVCVAAAFAPEAAKALFQLANQSLGWIFQNALRLVP